MFLYQRINGVVANAISLSLDFFARQPDGIEVMQAGAPVDWAIYDHADVLLASGSGVTSANGLLPVDAILPPRPSGRIKVVANGTAPGGGATDTMLAYLGVPGGVFGIVTSADTGSVTITPLDRGQTRTVPVVNGAFAAPDMVRLRGRFDAVFTGAGGATIARRFNKDRSDYFVRLVPAP